MNLDKATITMSLHEFKQLYNFAMAADNFIRGFKEEALDHIPIERKVLVTISSVCDADKLTHLRNEMAALTYAGQKIFF